MSKSKIAKDIVEAVLETPSFIKTVKVESKEQPRLKWWPRVLVFLHIISAPKRHKVNLDLYVSPAKLSTIFALSGLLHEVTEATSGKSSEHDTARDIHPLLVKIIATAIHNEDGVSPEWIEKVIDNQFTSAELNTAAKEVYRRLDYENFFGSILSLRAANVIDTQEIEAHGQPLEE